MRTLLVFLVLAACRGPASPRPSESEPLRVRGLDRPESAVWDERADVYLVSNIGAGDPFAEDGDGYVARVSPSGELLPRLVDGAAGEVRLDSPRGLALDGDTLYVADLRTVRSFDRATGATRGAWPVDGAVMLNDLVIGDGVLFASDSGLPAARQPAGARHGIYRFELAAAAPTAEVVIAAADLGRPGGLALEGGALWVATYGSGELYRICGDAICDRERLPQGNLDGVVVTGGRFLIASWEASAIYGGRPGGPWTVAVADVATPADLGYDARRGRVMIPLLEGGELAIVTP